MNRIHISIAILFLLVLGIYLPEWLATKPPLPEAQEGAEWKPDYLASNMQSSLYNEDGELNHQVYAQKMEHYQLLGFTLFTKPQYTIYVSRHEPPWHITAGEGTLFEDNRIQLESEVFIRSQNEDGFVQSIRTEFLEIDLTDKTLSSDEPVEISGQNFLINSRGFEGNLTTLQFEFTDHVQTEFSPR